MNQRLSIDATSGHRPGKRTALAFCLALTLTCAAARAQEAGPNLVPTPKSITLAGGSLALTGNSHVVATDAALKPLAGVLAGEISRLTGTAIEVADGQGGAGDIILKIDPALRADADITAVQGQKLVKTRDFAHTIKVSDRALVEGFDARAVAEGTATLLQAIKVVEGRALVTKMVVKDWPAFDYTGVMVDVAREHIPIDTLKAVIEACRLWKIRYCQLHLSDDEAFVFPSKAFPQAGSQNYSRSGGPTPRVYSLKELQDLVAFADARGVTLVPELDTPSHSQALWSTVPVFAGPKIMNITSDEMYKALDTLIGEMCEVFKSSPYFHIGGDEVYLFEIAEWKPALDYMQAKGIKDINEAMAQHAMRTNEIVRKHGKFTLAWEGAVEGAEGRPWTLPAPAPEQIVPMCWIPYPTAGAIRQQGYTTITVPWDTGALATFSPYNCNGVPIAPGEGKMLGAAQTMWMSTASAIVGNHLGGDVNGSSTEGYIRSLCDRMERTWNPDAKVDEAAYKAKLAATRSLMEALVLPVKIEGAPVGYPSWPVLGRFYCTQPVKVKLSSVAGAPGGEIRYTLDGTEPTATSPVYSGVLTVEGTTAVHAALFQNGKRAGAVSRACYEMHETDTPIANWVVAGPYVQEGKGFKALCEMAFDPETSGKGNWKGFSGPRVYLGAMPGFAGENRVAYLRTKIFSPKAQRGVLAVAADDDAKVFFNGTLVHGADKAGPGLAVDRMEVSLNQGWNVLLIKVTNADGAWEAAARIRGIGGAKLDGIQIKPE
ncbi:MAG: family 20 glycosylhydrolase [Planctomycetota bacterium]|nr:family 20 glycosylhydrolase [Planctomycetota bacterium]